MKRVKQFTGVLFAVLLSCPMLHAQAPNPEPDITTNAASPDEELQNNRPFILRKIYIEGNNKTKKYIILRELPFSEGNEYLLSGLVKKFEDARRLLMNTQLFHEVIVSLKSFDGYDVDLLITVKERWYLFPVPYFKIVDRNFNQWLVDHNASLSRTNYGAKIMYNNITGVNDKLNIWLMSGYTRQLSLSYDRLYLDKKLRWGMNVGVSLGKNREVNYDTHRNKQLFFKDTSRFVRSFFRTYAEATYRKAIKTRHRFGIGYVSERVTDTIIALNPKFFKSGHDRISFPELYYSATYLDVDYNPYPLQGYMAEIFFTKRGLNQTVDLWQFTAKASGSWKIANRTYFGSRVAGTIKLPFKQPYYNQRLLGYSDFYMQGYEYYVVDGVAGGYVKATLTREIMNVNFPVKRKKKDDLIRVPFRVYAKIYGNAGYIYNSNPGNNFLNNRMLYSSGFGIDIITHYDFTLKLEWTFNHLGQNGLYLHRKSFY
jgi:outer membrane protein assembly factor BamA